MAARLIVHTQVHENYGAHDWDGTGECPQYWKAKGGSDYLVAELSVEDAMKGPQHIQALVNAALPRIESCDEYWHEYVIDWGLYWEGELTHDEQMYADFGEDYSRIVLPLPEPQAA
jgi:hypothetical protein